MMLLVTVAVFYCLVQILKTLSRTHTHQNKRNLWIFAWSFSVRKVMWTVFTIYNNNNWRTKTEQPLSECEKWKWKCREDDNARFPILFQNPKLKRKEEKCALCRQLGTVLIFKWIIEMKNKNAQISGERKKNGKSQKHLRWKPFMFCSKKKWILLFIDI